MLLSNIRIESLKTMRCASVHSQTLFNFNDVIRNLLILLHCITCFTVYMIFSQIVQEKCFHLNYVCKKKSRKLKSQHSPNRFCKIFALHSRTLDGYSVTVILKSRNSVTKTDLHCLMYKILINKKKLFLPFLSLNIIWNNVKMKNLHTIC